jgi:hypothetical protein
VYLYSQDSGGASYPKMNFLPIDSTTLLAIFSGLFTAILVAFTVIHWGTSREYTKVTEKLTAVAKQLEAASLVAGQDTASLTEATRTLASSAEALTRSFHTLSRMEVRPRLEYVQVQKDLKLAGIEFELRNVGKGAARALTLKPSSSKGIQLGISRLSGGSSPESGSIGVGETQSYLLTGVKQSDRIELRVEFKDELDGQCPECTFYPDTS